MNTYVQIYVYIDIYTKRYEISIYLSIYPSIYLSSVLPIYLHISSILSLRNLLWTIERAGGSNRAKTRANYSGSHKVGT